MFTFLNAITLHKLCLIIFNRDKRFALINEFLQILHQINELNIFAINDPDNTNLLIALWFLNDADRSMVLDVSTNRNTFLKKYYNTFTLRIIRCFGLSFKYDYGHQF